MDTASIEAGRPQPEGDGDPPGAEAPAHRRLQPLRVALLALIVPPLLLLAITSGLVVLRQWEMQQIALHATLRDRAAGLLRAVDAELTVEQSALQTLAHSSLIDEGRWQDFHALAGKVAAQREGAQITLIDASDRMLLSTALPFGSPLPDLRELARQGRQAEWNGILLPVGSPGLARIARDTRQPVYSGLHYGMTIRQPLIAILVPVLRGRQVPQVLGFAFPPEVLGRILAGQLLPRDYRVRLIDPQGRIVAVGDDEDAAQVGHRLDIAVLERLRTSTGRVVELTAPGEPARLVAPVMSALSGWTLELSVPRDIAHAPAHRTLVAWIAAVLAALFAAGWLSLGLANRLARPLIRLARQADGPHLPMPRALPPDIREIAVLHDALQRARAAERQRQERALRLSLAEERERVAQENARASREREAQLRLALSAGRMGVWRMDLASRRVTTDSTYRHLWGLPAQAQEMDAEQLLARVHPDDLDRMRQAEQDALHTGHLQAEFRVIRHGAVHWLGAAADVVSGDDGTPVALLGVTQDITERRTLEAELRERGAALEAAHRQKDHFLAMLGHELRNPLAPIRSGAELLQRIGGDDPRVRITAERIARHATHMARLIEDLLDVARITQGKILLKTAPVELGAVLREAVETVRPMIDARRHRLHLAGPDGALHLQGDPTRLVQVFANLLTNAAKYTDEGGELWLRAARHGERAVVEVQDNGIGLPPELLPTLFEPFAQSAATLDRAQGGLGIGLALVRRLVELHGGSVEASSAGEGRGTLMRVTLPLCEAPSQTSPSQATPPPGGVAAAAGPRRVLVVDDNRDSADGLAALLGMEGHEVRVAYHGGAALELAAGFHPEVAILDLGLPEMDGRELARRLRALPDGAQMRLVALTGYGSREDRRSTREAGFDHHLVKPVDFGALSAALEGRALQGS